MQLCVLSFKISMEVRLCVLLFQVSTVMRFCALILFHSLKTKCGRGKELYGVPIFSASTVMEFYCLTPNAGAKGVIWCPIFRATTVYCPNTKSPHEGRYIVPCSNI